MTLAERFWSKVEATNACWLWRGKIASNGYGHFFVEKIEGKTRLVGAHRMAWRLVNGEIPAGLDVCHRCDHPGCVRPTHLFLGTVSDNMADARRKGRTRRGAAHPLARLTVGQVREIRRLYAAGSTTHHSLAARFGVSPSEIGNIIARKTWADAA